MAIGHFKKEKESLYYVGWITTSMYVKQTKSPKCFKQLRKFAQMILRY
jgi:hypothetical protein